MARLVIKPHRPWQWVIAVITLSALIAVLVWALLDDSYWRVITAAIGDNNEVRTLQRTNRDLEEQNRALNSRILELEQTTRLDRETATMLQQEMVALQDQIYRLKRELEFYQGVMDTARQTAGMDIHGLYVEPAGRAGRYLLKLVLTHVGKNDTVMKGGLSVTIAGTRNGEAQRLDLADLIDKKADLTFEMKSFKRLEYEFALEEGFTADEISVRVEPRVGGEPPVSRTYDWPI